MKKSVLWKKNCIISILLIIWMTINPVMQLTVSAEPADDAENVADAENIDELIDQLHLMATDQPILALVYLNSHISVYEQAGRYSNEVITIPCGQTVMIEGAEFEQNLSDEGYQMSHLWFYVSFYDHNVKYYGYVAAGNVVTADERFLNWKKAVAEALETQSPNPSKVLGISTFYADIEQFPDSYKQALVDLKEEHPQWVFVPMETDIDWDTAIANEIDYGKSLVHKSLPIYYREGAYDDSSWYFASEAALRLYMDPRNSLKENAIFQFEQLTYNESYHTEEALESFLSNSFMNSEQNAPGTDMTFAKIIQAVGEEKNVSPYHMAARIYQEQGRDGTSPLISGTYPGYEGYYNYFNVGAVGESVIEYIENGLSYAKDHDWQGAYYSISGGADTISRNYISRGQDTLYLQKFNVTTNSTFSHQYMQNISAPTSEAASMMKLYSDADSIDSMFVFKIPVFENMPEEASPVPVSSSNIALEIPDGYDPVIYLDGIACDAISLNGLYIVSAPGETMTNAVVYQYNESGVPVGMYVWTLQYTGSYYQVTEQPELKDLLSYHGFSIRITGKSGIRCKTGISQEVKEQLLDDGIDGYKLKEYGTLVMNKANLVNLPMIKNGTKVVSGISYGLDANGEAIDKVFETVDGRQRYTAVLVGLPADQYKTEFAFRGYVVLEKDGVTTTIYGPIKSRSIYQLAEQMLASGKYPEDSSTGIFLNQLISDAQ